MHINSKFIAIEIFRSRSSYVINLEPDMPENLQWLLLMRLLHQLTWKSKYFLLIDDISAMSINCWVNLHILWHRVWVIYVFDILRSKLFRIPLMEYLWMNISLSKFDNHIVHCCDLWNKWNYTAYSFRLSSIGESVSLRTFIFNKAKYQNGNAQRVCVCVCAKGKYDFSVV